MRSRTSTACRSPASGFSRCTGRASGPTSRSIGSPISSPPASRSGCTGTGRASATIPILRIAWMASWPPWNGPPGRGRGGGSPRRTCGVPSGSSDTGPRSASRKALGNSFAGMRRSMDVSAEHLVEQARDRFQLQDYYGAIHLLEEVVAAGRAFADAHHMLGLSYSLVGQQEQALTQLDRALGLNPHYVEALVHRAIVLNELGREAEADAAFRRAAQVGGEPRQGFPAHVAAKLANQHAALGDAYLGAGGLTQAIGEYQEALTLGPAFHDLRYKLGRMLLEAGRALDAREHFEIIVRARPGYLDAAAMLGLACYLAGDGLAAKAVWEECRERRPEDARVEAYLAMLARNDAAVPVAVPASGGDGDPPSARSGRKKKS